MVWQESRILGVTSLHTLFFGHLFHSLYFPYVHILRIKLTDFGQHYKYPDIFPVYGIISHKFFYLFIGLYHILKECRQLHVHDDEMPQHLDVEQILPKTLPPLHEFTRSITKQFILHSSIEDSSLLQEIPLQEYCELQTLDVALHILYPLDIQFARCCTPPIVIHNRIYSR